MASIDVAADERWLPIPDLPPYEVSDLGRVRGHYGLMAIQKFRGGYRQISLCRAGKPKSYWVHRLVMLAFVGPSELWVDHINADPQDNRLENLRYCTPQENFDYMRAAGREATGVRNGRVLLNEEQVREIWAAYVPNSSRQHSPVDTVGLAKRFGVSRFTVWNIISGRTWVAFTSTLGPLGATSTASRASIS